MKIRLGTALVMAACAALLLAAYLPPVMERYGVVDDYSFLMFHLPPGLKGDSWATHLATGRPVVAVIHELTLGFVRSIDDLRWIRLGTLLGLMAVGLALGATLTAAGWTALEAGAIVVITLSMPAFQVLITWAMLGPALVVAALFAAAAAALCARPGRGPAIGAVVCMSLAFITYQGFAMFIWLFLAARVLKPDEPETWPRMRDEAFHMAKLMLPALVVGFIVWYVGKEVWPVLTGERMTLGAPLSVKLVYVWTTLEAAFSLNHIPPSAPLAVSVALFMVVGLICFLKPPRLARLAWCVLLLPTVWIPYFVSTECNLTYRSQAVLTSLLTLYAACAVRGIARKPAISGVLLAIWAVAAAYMAGRDTMQYIARPQAVEARYLTEQLRACDNTQPLEGPPDQVWNRRRLLRTPPICIVASRWTDSPGPSTLVDLSEPYTLMDDYGAPSTVNFWCVRPTAEVLMLRPLSLRVIETVEAAPPGAPVIDMRRLRELRPPSR